MKGRNTVKIVATTTQTKTIPAPEYEQFLAETGLLFVPRQHKSLATIAREHETQAVLVWQPNGPILHIGSERFFFHPSMAKNRLASYRHSGTIDPLIRACALEEGSSFLDCTLGLGADAIVAAYFARAGRVVALESSPLIAAIVKWGMKVYHSGIDWLDQAIHSIEVINGEHYLYLKKLGDNSFDIVYFDPMFQKPRYKSTALTPLRLLANHQRLSREVLGEACRVARKRVVVKEMPASREFERLGIEKIIENPNNPIAYGVLEIQTVK